MDDQKVTGGADWLYKSRPDDLNEVDKTLKSYKITCISGEGKSYLKSVIAPLYHCHH